MKTHFKLLIVTAAAIMLAALGAAYQPVHASGQWYVAPGGSDSNDYTSPATACASVDGALAKPEFVAYDTVLVATGTCTAASGSVVTITASSTLHGDWNNSFNARTGVSAPWTP